MKIIAYTVIKSPSLHQYELSLEAKPKMGPTTMMYAHARACERLCACLHVRACACVRARASTCVCLHVRARTFLYIYLREKA